MINLLKRAWYWMEEYHLTISIDNYTRALEFLTDEKTRSEVVMARSRTRKDRTKVRGKYNATFKPGFRKTWIDA